MIKITFKSGEILAFSLIEYSFKYYEAVKMIIVSPLSGNKLLPKFEYSISDIDSVEIT